MLDNNNPAAADLLAKVLGARKMPDYFKPTLSEDEKAYCRALMLALEPFRDLRTTMPLQYVYTFLQVAVDEGKSVTEYAKNAGVSTTVMTRHMLDIGDRNRAQDDGFGLITADRDPNDLRRHHARVTPIGKALVRRVMNALNTIRSKGDGQ